MPTLRTIAARLFTHPRGSPPGSQLLFPAARAHQHLFECECQYCPELCNALPRLMCRSRDNDHPHDRLFCHPAFVEALHRLATTCPRLTAWHNAVASPSMLDVIPDTGHDFGGLGGIEFVLRLRDGCQWDRPLRVTTDTLGRLQFVGSDWRITLHSSHAGVEGVLAEEPIDVCAAGHAISFQTAGGEFPFLNMPRETCRQMVVDNPASLESGVRANAGSRIRPQFNRALPLCETGARYERVHIENAEHAKTTAGIVDTLHDAMRRVSPAMHAEFCAYISAIRGYELRLSTQGTVQSFSDPTAPGIMSLNIPYNERHEPCFSPLCFTWLAHELAHTKVYLINDIAFDHGCTFVNNGADMTDAIERYGRPLPIRTLFQVPYTHIYEWESLMDFIENDFAGLPWPIDEDPVAFGDDLKNEIEEALSYCVEIADLTPLGIEAFSRFTSLYDQSLTRWRTFAAA